VRRVEAPAAANGLYYWHLRHEVRLRYRCGPCNVNPNTGDDC
jgi:hypothetical protein